MNAKNSKNIIILLILIIIVIAFLLFKCIRKTPPSMPQDGITVDCFAGESLADKINKSSGGETFIVSGKCKERTIKLTGANDNTTIIGEPNSMLTPTESNFFKMPVLIVDGAKNVVVENVRIENGLVGLLVENGADVKMANNKIRYNKLAGLCVVGRQNGGKQITKRSDYSANAIAQRCGGGISNPSGPRIDKLKYKVSPRSSSSILSALISDAVAQNSAAIVTSEQDCNSIYRYNSGAGIVVSGSGATYAVTGTDCHVWSYDNSIGLSVNNKAKVLLLGNAQIAFRYSLFAHFFIKDGSFELNGTSTGLLVGDVSPSSTLDGNYYIDPISGNVFCNGGSLVGEEPAINVNGC